MSNFKPTILFNSTSARLDNDCACPDIPFLLMGFQAEREDDCACPDKPFRPTLVRDGMTSQGSDPECAEMLLQITPQLYTDSLPADFTLAFSPFSPGGPAMLNRPAMGRLWEFQRPQPLEQAVDYSLAEAGLLVPAGRPPAVHWGQLNTLTAWLHITNACNLDCPYCYVRKSNARMSAETGLAVVETVFRTAERHAIPAIKLKYAGGEAALHFQLVQQLHHRAQYLATATGRKLQAVILSNGTVWTPAMARWLVDTNVKLMISLDGVGATHDAQRHTHTGRGTFARIEQVVDEVLLPAGVRPDISITITGRSAPSAAAAVVWAIERDLPFSFNFYRENLLSAGQPGLKLEESQIIEGMRQAYQVVEQHLPTRPFLGGLLDRVQVEAHAHPCGVGQSYLVFNHTGHVAQCQMRLDEAITVTSADDILNLVAHGPIPVISVEDKPGCQDCLWRYRCAGGCPLETYRASGRFDGPSPHCGIYRTLFPEALRLEGLRLLKIGGYLT